MLAQIHPEFLVFCNVGFKAHEEGYIELLGLDVLFKMIGSCFQILNFVRRAHRSKTFSDKLSTIVRNDLPRDAVGEQPIFKEDTCNVRDCCPGRFNSSIQL